MPGASTTRTHRMQKCGAGSDNIFEPAPVDNPSGFDDVFNLAKTRELSGDELKKYIMAMVNEYDKYVIGEYFRREGVKEGEAEEKECFINALRKAGVSEDAIAKAAADWMHSPIMPGPDRASLPYAGTESGPRCPRGRKMSVRAREWRCRCPDRWENAGCPNGASRGL